MKNKIRKVYSYINQYHIRYLRLFFTELKILIDKNNIQYISSFRYYNRWRNSLINKSSQISIEPWIPFQAIDLLKNYLKQDMKVFEFGMGGSTIFFLNHVKNLVSVEHDSEWFDKVSVSVKNKYKHKYTWTPSLHIPEPIITLDMSPSDPDSFLSSAEPFINMSFQSYVEEINKYPDGFFDVVLVDGRSRPSCFKRAMPKVKQGGLLILDNSERLGYSEVKQLVKNLDWEETIYFSPGPLNHYFWETSIYKRNK